MTNAPESTVSTVDTTLEIVHTLQRVGSATIEGLADELGIASSTVHRHLLTLREQGYVVKDDGYRLGMRFLTLGGNVQTTHPVFELVKPKVDQVASETGERAQFIVGESGHRYYLYTQTGKNAVQTDAVIGKRGLLHTSASGKAILAALSDERVSEIIEKDEMLSSTENTITDLDTLFEELERIRDTGIAFNEQESTVGLHAVGAAVCDSDGHPIGALSVSGPAHRLKGEKFRKQLPDLVLASANELELKLEFQ